VSNSSTRTGVVLAFASVKVFRRKNGNNSRQNGTVPDEGGKRRASPGVERSSRAGWTGSGAGRNFVTKGRPWRILLQNWEAVARPRDEFFEKRNEKQSLIRIASVALPKSPVSLACAANIPRIVARKPRLRPGEFLRPCAAVKRLCGPQAQHGGVNSPHGRTAQGRLACRSNRCADLPQLPARLP
jgi:hypothetical protein